MLLSEAKQILNNNGYKLINEKRTNKPTKTSTYLCKMADEEGEINILETYVKGVLDGIIKHASISKDYDWYINKKCPFYKKHPEIKIEDDYLIGSKKQILKYNVKCDGTLEDFCNYIAAGNFDAFGFSTFYNVINSVRDLLDNPEYPEYGEKYEIVDGSTARYTTLRIK